MLRAKAILAILSVTLVAFALRPSARTSFPVAPAKHGPTMPAATSRPRVIASYGKLPLSFEANVGQTNPAVKFLSRGRGYTLFLTGDEAVLSLKKSGGRSQESEARMAKLGIGKSRLGTATGFPRPLIENLGAAIPDSQPRTLSAESYPPAVLRMRLVGANPGAAVTGADELQGKSNYFIGNDPKKWRTNVPTYAKVKYKDVYPGIDLVYYGNQGQLEYDFVVKPGANAKAIALDVAAIPKASGHGHGGVKPPLQIAANGDLVVAGDGGEVRFHKPIVYQPAGRAVNGQSKIQNRKLLDGRYVLLADNTVGFRLPPYDRSEPLVIDPTLVYSTYLGGSGSDQVGGLWVDSLGNAYVAGNTASADFPTTSGVVQGTYIPSYGEVFVAKLNAAGSQLIFSTFLGGGGFGGIGAGPMAVDASGNVYAVAGGTTTTFPTTPGAFQTTSPLEGCGGGGSTGMVFKLNPSGSALLYSTYLSGPGCGSFNTPNGIAVDLSGNAFIVGVTEAGIRFPTTPGAFQTANRNPISTGYVTKLNPTGSALIYSTYLGGSGGCPPSLPFEAVSGVILDGSGDAFLVGTADSFDFPTTPGAFQTTFGGCPADAFVAEMNPTGTGLTFSTLLGGSGKEQIYGQGQVFALDSAGNIYVSGATNSTDFPVTPNALQPSHASDGGNADAFVSVLNPTGSSLLYSTYLGGNGFDGCTTLALEPSGEIVVGGFTSSTNFPTVNAIQAGFGGGPYDGFVAVLSPSGGLSFSTYLGGSGETIAYGLAVEPSGGIYVAGWTSSSDFPVTAGALQTVFGGGTFDGFVAKISPTTAPAVGLSPTSLTFGHLQVGTQSTAQSVTVTDTGSSSLHITNISASSDFLESDNCTPAAISPGGYCTIQVSFLPTAIGARSGTLSITDDATGSPQTVSLSGTGDPASTTLSVSAPSATYGSTSAITVSVTSGAGTVAGSVSLAVDGGSPTTQALSSGSTTFTLSGLSAGNHNLSATYSAQGIFAANSATGALTVTQAQLTITANNASRAYGAANPTFTATYNGFVNGSNQSVLTGTLTCGTTATASSPVSGSPYAITCSGQSSSNYALSYAPGQLTVTAAPLTITASSGAMVYGGPAYVVGAIFYGFVNGETNLSLTQQPACLPLFTSTTQAGTYVSSCGGAVDNNYAFTYVTGSVMVSQASSAVLLASSSQSSDLAGQALIFTATVTDNSPGSVGTPTGTVQFVYSGVGTIASAVPLTNGVATFIYAPIWAGTATAVYSGDNNFMGSNSNAVGQAVTAAPIASIAPAEVQYTNQAVNTTSQPQPVKISNIGTAPLNISSVSITGSASDDFSLTNNCPKSLPGLTSPTATPSSCVVYAAFTPDDTGVRAATLTFTDNDPLSSPQLIGLTGLAQSAITSDFDRTKIAAGNYIWFNADFVVRGPVGRDATQDPVQIFFNNSTVTFTSNGTQYNLAVPNAVVVFSPTATAATTTYDTVNSRWVTTVPSIHPTKDCGVYTVDTRTFLTGFAFQVPAGGLPGDIHPVTWSGSFASDTPGVSVQWRWGAAVYTQFSTNYNALGVKPVEDDHETILPAWWVPDPAGTPENYKQYWIPGASADVRDKYTGDASRVVGVSPAVAPLSLSPTELNFGSSQVGATSTTSPMTVTVTNNGAIPVTISSITVTGTHASDFVIQSNTCASPLASPPSSSTSPPPNVCTISVAFTPGDVGTRSGVLAITSGPDGNTQSTQTVDLGGNGTP